uniref:EGF-like domain-containing protein n=1 Tax=Acrobeloides nanus TaxID=290746 RepID=A0A914EB03_9BILA
MNNTNLTNDLVVAGSTTSAIMENTTKLELKEKSTSTASVTQPNLPPPIPTVAPTLASVPVNDDNDNSDFAGVMSSTWERLKKLVGFGHKCLNGGNKNLRGDCVCPQYYEGEQCERIICVNNGTRVKVNTIPVEEVCKCPYPEFVSGKHCEQVTCLHNGRYTGNGQCKCIDNWYTGQFCQNYAASWFAVLGIPALCIAIIILCCIVCRLDLCPRRTSTRRHRRRNLNQRRPDTGVEQALMVQENLLNEGTMRHFNHSGIPPTYVVRLENIPTYNPQLLASEDFKPTEPPPPYDQAVSRCPAISHANDLVNPPNYTQSNESIGVLTVSNRPPLPRFRPPDIPRN